MTDILNRYRNITYRFATQGDAPKLAQLNKALIDDEGHRNLMSIPELETRMRNWLSAEYQAVLFECASDDVGYALFRLEAEYVYLRQFYVQRERRRQGIGRDATAWLVKNAWCDAPRIRLDVLVGNTTAIAFWRAVGFHDYCLTMEIDL